MHAASKRTRGSHLQCVHHLVRDRDLHVLQHHSRYSLHNIAGHMPQHRLVGGGRVLLLVREGHEGGNGRPGVRKSSDSRQQKQQPVVMVTRGLYVRTYAMVCGTGIHHTGSSLLEPASLDLEGL